MSRRTRILILVGVTVLAAGIMAAVPPFAQPLWYHDFADQRTLCSVPHFWNVVSNLPFVVVGVGGMVYLAPAQPRRRNGSVIDAGERWTYLIFFLCIALTGVGSAYYHADPNNDTLLWDRMPLAMAFMALFA